MNSKLPAIAAALGAAALFSASAHAGGIFTVTPHAVDATWATPATSFQADQIAGNYNEVVTFNNVNSTFTYSIFWYGTAFTLGNAVPPIPTYLNNQPGSAISSQQYTLYATLKGTGTYSLGGGGVGFTPDPGGIFSVMAAHDLTSYVPPATGAGAWTLTPSGPQYDLASGVVQSANGQVILGCPNSNCGSFGVTTGFALIPPSGPQFFSAPDPFYNISFEAGGFKDTTGHLTQDIVAAATAGGTVGDINGGAQVTFAMVPEPSALALVGLGLVAAGAVRRRASRKA